MAIKMFDTRKAAKAFVAKRRRQGYASQAHELANGRIAVYTYPGGTKETRNIVTSQYARRRNR